MLCVWCQSVIFICIETPILLSDAEAGEDGGEDVGGGDGAGDGGEVVEGFADVLGDEVAGEVGGEAVDYKAQGCGGREEGAVMAGVGYDDGVGGVGCVGY